MKVKIKIDRYGMLTYAYDIGPDGGCAFHMFSEVGEPWVPGFRALIERKGLKIAHGIDIPCHPYCADFVVQDTPERYKLNARVTDEVFTYTSDTTHWYVLNRITLKLFCVGLIGGSRGHGRGINYCDRAKERAAQMNAAFSAYYELRRRSGAN